MSLYDRYSQANSNVIPMYEGSAGQDFVKVGEYKQGQYDLASQGAANIGDSAANMNVSGSGLNGVDQAADELRNSTDASLKDLAAKGNYEDAVPAVQELGRNFANRSREIYAPIQAMHDYHQQLLSDKDKNLTPDMIQSLVGMSRDAFNASGGLYKNGRGQYDGKFVGGEVAKNIDVTKKVNEIMTGIQEDMKGVSWEHAPGGGLYVIHSDKTRTFVTPEKVASVLHAGLANDTEFQAHVKQQSAIAGWKASKVTDPNQVPDTMPDGSNNILKDNSIQLSHDKGLPFGAAYGAHVADATANEINRNALKEALGRSFMKASDKTSYSVDEPVFDAMKHARDAKEANGAGSAFAVQGPNYKLSNDEQDVNKLKQNVVAGQQQVGIINSRITKLTRDLENKNLAPGTRTQIESELNEAKGNLANTQAANNRGQDILNYSNDKTARKLGYTDYADFQSTQRPKLASAIVAGIGGQSFVTKSGRSITANEIADAAMDNRISPISESISGGTGTPGGGGTNQTTGATITLKDGTTVTVPGSRGAKLWGTVTEAIGNNVGRGKEFQDNLKTIHSQLKDFSVQGMSMPIQEKDAKELDQVLRPEAAGGGVTFSDPGQLTKTDAPADFRVRSLSTAGNGPSSVIKVEGYDKDGKSTGKYYDMHVNNSTINNVISKRLGASEDNATRALADGLTEGSGVSQLTSKIPGQSLPVMNGKGEDTGLSVAIKRNDNQTITYSLVDKNGHIQENKGQKFITSDAAEAGTWVDNINNKNTYSNHKRKDVEDKGRTTNEK